jgi:hypothetical protein
VERSAAFDPASGRSFNTQNAPAVIKFGRCAAFVCYLRFLEKGEES